MLVEIWSDVVCPWCAVGRARFLKARSRFEAREEVRIRWRSFELDPERERTIEGSYVEMLAGRYRTSLDRAQEMVDTMARTGASEGIDFRFDLARPGNTFDAHRVLHLAADRDLQDAVKTRFLEGYHTQGAPIGEPETIVSLAVDGGLDQAEVRSVLTSSDYADEVRADERRALELGITGVPFFLVDGRYAVSGAQPADHHLAVLEAASSRG